jgi:hypothetical protein
MRAVQSTRALLQESLFVKSPDFAPSNNRSSVPVHTSLGLGSSILTASTDPRVFPGRPVVTTRYDGVMLRHT